MGAIYFIFREGSYTYRKGETSMNSAIVDWLGGVSMYSQFSDRMVNAEMKRIEMICVNTHMKNSAALSTERKRLGAAIT